jgi:hypothetical protein
MKHSVAQEDIEQWLPLVQWLAQPRREHVSHSASSSGGASSGTGPAGGAGQPASGGNAAQSGAEAAPAALAIV